LQGQFKSEADLRRHAEANSCAPRHEYIEGVDRNQKAKLSKPVPRTLSLEDQWFFIFDILFPGFEPKPRSPYVEDNVEPVLSAFHDFMAHEGATVLMRKLQARGLVTSSAGDEGQLLLATLAEGQEAIVDGWNSRLRDNYPAQSPHSSGPLPTPPPSGPTSSIPLQLVDNRHIGESLIGHGSAPQSVRSSGVDVLNAPAEIEPHSHSINKSEMLPGNAHFVHVPSRA
jgi:hypothetical protein